MNKDLKHLSLIIMDGAGERKEIYGNALKLANTPFLNFLKKNYPSILMNASEEWVGLPKGQMGNSEVGHLNIGSGRIVKQSILEIKEKLNDKKFFKNEVFKNAIKHLRKNNSNLHLLGLFSEGGVHSSLDHFYDLKNKLDEENINFFLHAFTDGRDTDPKSALDLIKKAINVEKINVASISGRYYAMDRDRRWERIQLAYDVIVNRKGKSFSDPVKFIEESYQNNVTDEFIVPGFNEEIKGQIKDGDVILIFNFRSDRIREISYMFLNDKSSGYDYENKNKLKNIFLVSLKEMVNINSNVLFETKEIKNTLGDVLEKNNISQIRAAETEKYPHVTFFMDGGKLLDRKNEIKILVPSPKVATYDLKPEMSAIELTDKLLNEIPKNKVSIINYANPDMVGHTGVLSAGIRAVETVDQMLERLYDLIVKELDGIMIVIADHGNCEKMLNYDGSPNTAHTTNKVRFYLVSKDFDFKKEYKKEVIAKLSNLAPTMLDILEIKKPSEMTEDSVVVKK
ncbi:MAG: 2,3-bisphosphoglycerate-independent phosphoglycerate mutase [Candidatus Hepatoplasma vulgare]|nr:MAG: 2,3-bisphosphoglycerate-independent phosphoglycerate mutase [Candidatus Hepatoplasma sp.]